MGVKARVQLSQKAQNAAVFPAASCDASWQGERRFTRRFRDRKSRDRPIGKPPNAKAQCPRPKDPVELPVSPEWPLRRQDFMIDPLTENLEFKSVPVRLS